MRIVTEKKAMLALDDQLTYLLLMIKELLEKSMHKNRLPKEGK